MDDVLQIQERIDAKMEEVAKVNALAATENRDLTDEELTTNDATIAEVERLKHQQEQLTRMSKLVADQLAPTPEPKGDRVVKPKGTPDVRVGIDNLSRDPNRGFRNFGEFCLDVRHAAQNGNTATAKLTRAATTYGTEGIGADGGYAVPPGMSTAILTELEDESSLLQLAAKDTIQSNSMTYPKDEATPWGTTGIYAEWEGEGATYGEKKPSLDTTTIKANKLVALVKVTDELLADSSALNTYMSRKAASAIRFKTDLAINQGSGAGQPLGFRDQGSTIAIARATATEVNEADVRGMWVRLYGPWRKSAVWLANQNVESELMSMQGLVTNVAGTENVGGYPVYLPQGGYSASPFATLFGRPVIYTQTCDDLGSKGDLCLCDFQQYQAVIKGGLRSDSSVHLHFDQDVVSFKFVLRVGGAPMWESAISPRDGSNTLSAFVVLTDAS